MLFNTGRLSYCWPCDEREVIQKVVFNYGNRGVVNSGLFCGKIERILELFRQAAELYGAYINDNFEHPVLCVFSEDMKGVLRKNRGVYRKSDQFFLQLLQTAGNSIIQVDKDKHLLALFADKYPYMHNREHSRNFADLEYVGRASVLHSPWMSRSVLAWNGWIDEEICREKLYSQ